MKKDMMRQSRGIAGLISALAVLTASADAAAPVTIAVSPIQSAGGETSFCPSTSLQREIVRTLSQNPAFSVQVADSQQNPAQVQLTGIAVCSLEQRQRQYGFLFQQRSVITTARVELRLQLIHPSTGAAIATISEQGTAQSETQLLPEPPLTQSKPQADVLFEKAVDQALNAVLPKVNAALAQPTL